MGAKIQQSIQLDQFLPRRPLPNQGLVHVRQQLTENSAIQCQVINKLTKVDGSELYIHEVSSLVVNVNNTKVIQPGRAKLSIDQYYYYSYSGIRIRVQGALNTTCSYLMINHNRLHGPLWPLCRTATAYVCPIHFLKKHQLAA